MNTNEQIRHWAQLVNENFESGIDEADKSNAVCCEDRHSDLVKRTKVLHDAFDRQTKKLNEIITSIKEAEAAQRMLDFMKDVASERPDLVNDRFKEAMEELTQQSKSKYDYKDQEKVGREQWEILQALNRFAEERDTIPDDDDSETHRKYGAKFRDDYFDALYSGSSDPWADAEYASEH